MTFNSHALRECLELEDGDYTTMPSQAATSQEKYKTTQEAFELNARIQRAVGDDAYFSEKMQLFSPKAMQDLITLRRDGTEINGKSDCEGFFIDTHLQNSDCHFKAMPASEESVELHNHEKYYVKNKKSQEIDTKEQFINWLSSLAGQRENMSRSDFFAHQIARKYVTNDIPIIKAQKNLYLPTLMRNGHSLNGCEKILSALKNDKCDQLSEKQKVIYDQFVDDVENIPHPQRQKIKQRILAQVREVLNFAKEKATSLTNDDLKLLINTISTAPNKTMPNDNDASGGKGKQKGNNDSAHYNRVNTMPRMQLPKNKKQAEIKNDFIAIR